MSVECECESESEEVGEQEVKKNQPQRGGMLVARGKAARPQPRDVIRTLVARHRKSLIGVHLFWRASR